MLQNILKFQGQRIVKWWQQAPQKQDNDAALISSIASCSQIDEQLQLLIDYFWKAHKHYANQSLTRAHYPGFSSMHGSDSDGIEGISRLLPLWASYCVYSKHKPEHQGLNKSMCSHIKTSLCNGTNVEHSGYWGDALSYEQIICEASDIALATWISREDVFYRMSDIEQQQVVNWLRSFVDKDVSDNNWHLFIVIIDVVLSELDPTHVLTSQHHLARIQEFYVANGAFTDGSSGEIDYYNAWCFHYLLFWIDKIRPNTITWSYQHQLHEYSHWYQYLFTQTGFPIYGRSVCYRFAAATPLLGASLLPNSNISTSSAVSINFYVWRFFILQGGLSKGRPNQGIFADDASMLDNYSGPASGFWGTRSLVMLMTVLQQDDSCSLSSSLPSDNAITLDLPKIGMTIISSPSNHEVVLEQKNMTHTIIDNSYYQAPWKNTLREIVYGISFRGQPSTFLNRQSVSSNLSMYQTSAEFSSVYNKGTDSRAGN